MDWNAKKLDGGCSGSEVVECDAIFFLEFFLSPKFLLFRNVRDAI